MPAPPRQATDFADRADVAPAAALADDGDLADGSEFGAATEFADRTASTQTADEDRADSMLAAGPGQTWEPEPPPQPPLEPPPQPPLEPRYAALGADGLARLRARYADVRARIETRPGEDAERAQLLAQAERLNPDAWRTEDEVAHALEEYEVDFEALRPFLGRPPRSRRL